MKSLRSVTVGVPQSTHGRPQHEVLQSAPLPTRDGPAISLPGVAIVRFMLFYQGVKSPLAAPKVFGCWTPSHHERLISEIGAQNAV
ncbi:MAG: hypothetical protein AAF648_14380 [Pseudomonadota bacterium]